MNDNARNGTRLAVQAGVIAALYAALTLTLAPISSGPLQIRVAEALTVLPFLTPAALPGLFLGCLTANLFVGEGVYDIVLGPLVTLLAAWLSRRMPRRYLAPLPPVLLNGIYVGTLLHFLSGLPLVPTALAVGAGEWIACYGLGYPLLLLLERRKEWF